MSETSDDRTILNGPAVEHEGLADWRILFSALHARFETSRFTTGVQLVNAIAEAAEEANHHPDITLTYPRVDVRLHSHDVGGVTQRDVRLARRISEMAAEVGATARPDQVSVIELALDSHDFDEIKPFWAALLGYEPGTHPDEIVDPDGTMPTVWFQATDPHDPPRQRWHVDIRVPPEQAEPLIEKALAAGGTIVGDDQAPTFWVLSDPQGNKACVTTWAGRTQG